MDEISFDPRSWGAKQSTGAKPASDPKGEALPEALPEAWRSVAAGLDRGAGQASPSPVRNRRIGLFLTLSVAIAAGGGAWLYFADRPAAPRAEPTAAPQPQAAPVAPGLPEAERSLNLSDKGQLAGALAALGIAQPEALAAAQAAGPMLTKPGELRARMSLAPQGDGFLLQRLQLSYPDGSGVVVGRDAAGRFAARGVAAELVRQVKVLTGELDSESFYTSAVSAGLTDALIPEFINAFAYDFNLASEVSPGDTFEVAYEQSVNEDGEAVGPPQLLFASLTTKAKSLALYRFVDGTGKVGWYDGNGASTKRGLMRTPVDGARITSKFGMRFHPVLHYNKLHGGVDFAAPSGTPIYAAADGKVEFAALKGANGNLTVLLHDNGWRTLYLHQSRFMPGIAPGVRVLQGQHIGDIGTTGRSTGPHLHYEVHIDGQRVDPLTIKTGDGKRELIEGPALAAFRRERDRVDVARAQSLF